MYIVQLGPSESLSPRTKFQFGPKLNTKVALNTHPPPPPKTFTAVPGNLVAWNFVWILILLHSAQSENLSSAISQLEDGPRSGIIITPTIISCGGGGGGAKHSLWSVMDIIVSSRNKWIFLNSEKKELMMPMNFSPFDRRRPQNLKLFYFEDITQTKVHQHFEL